MNVEDLLYEIDEAVENATTLPVFGKVLLDGNEIKELVKNILCNLPEELKQARAIVADRNNIISAAKREADSITKKASEQAAQMVARDEIVRSAQAAATDIIAQAQAKSRDMRAAASEYVDTLMKEADEAVAQSINKLAEARQQTIANVNEDFDLCIGQVSDKLSVIRKTRHSLRSPKHRTAEEASTSSNETEA